MSKHFDADTQYALDATRAKLLQVETLLLEVCELADNEQVYDYLAHAFGDWQAEVQGSLDEVAFTFGKASEICFYNWRDR